MRSYSFREFFWLALFIGLILSCAGLSRSSVTFGQDGGIGNSISGHVFGVDRRPLSNLHVELVDDLSRTIARARTNASGHYSFFRLPAGRFAVRVLPFGTDYEEQEQTVEITNFRRSSGSGGDRLAGMTNEQKDFYLRPRKGVVPGVTGAVFAQDVPAQARKLYEAAVDDLANKKTNEAYTGLKSAIEIFPKYFAALELLGLEYARVGHFEAARVLLVIAVNVNARAYKSWHGLAIALNEMKSYPEALAAVEKSIEINPIVPESLLLSGALMRQGKNYAEAEKRLIKAKEFGNDSTPEVYWQLALLYANGLKRYKDAARELRSYLKVRPDHKDAENIKKLIAELDKKARTS